jgi:hypothetical protein
VHLNAVANDVAVTLAEGSHDALADADGRVQIFRHEIRVGLIERPIKSDFREQTSRCCRRRVDRTKQVTLGLIVLHGNGPASLIDLMTARICHDGCFGLFNLSSTR